MNSNNVINIFSKDKNKKLNKCKVCGGKGSYFTKGDSVSSAGWMFCATCNGSGIESFDLPPKKATGIDEGLIKIDNGVKVDLVPQYVVNDTLKYLRSIFLLYNANEMVAAFKLQDLMEFWEEYKIKHFEGE